MKKKTKSYSRFQAGTYYHALMLNRLLIACAALLTGSLVAATCAWAQADAFARRFDAVLSQHGVVGGGISIVHMQELTTQLFFGKAG
jgi:hypothetical protein